MPSQDVKRCGAQTFSLQSKSFFQKYGKKSATITKVLSLKLTVIRLALA